MNPYELKTEFNDVSGERGYNPALAPHTYAPTPKETPPAPETAIGKGHVLFDETATAIWARHGLDAPAFSDAIAALPPDKQQSLLRNTQPLLQQDENFANVMKDMAQNRKKKLGEMMFALANVPDGMTLITTVYARISPEQNAAVWQEFQERAEPAFYAYLLKHHRQDLQDAGLCAYGIGCLERGVAPTTQDGTPYNIDVDHIIERAGGGKMSMEKSIDPDNPAAPASYPINHISNLCLIMRGKHEQKNKINGLQILPVEAGQKKRIVMAVADTAHARVLLNPARLKAEDVPAAEMAYFAQGASILLKKNLEQMQNVIEFTPTLAARVFASTFQDQFDHLSKIWENAACAIEKSANIAPFTNKETAQIEKACVSYLKPLIQKLADCRMPPPAIKKLSNIGNRIENSLHKPDTGSLVHSKSAQNNINGKNQS